MANKDKWSAANPWLGLAPYTEGTSLYGRDEETIVLSNIIKNNLATIVFGKSGVGKSSLLGAGISPALREEQYIPIKIRLVHNSDVTYIEQIEDEVRKRVNCADSLPVSVPSLGLWDFFHRHSFTRKEDGEECTPVVILDQFEEIYTLTDEEHKSVVHSFFQELSSLLNDIKPDHVVEKERQYASYEPATFSVGSSKLMIKRVPSSVFAYSSDINFRFVICLREDKLYLLERNSTNIPALKNNRFNLKALSVESATEVIMRPRSDLFVDAEATSIIDKLADMGDEGVRTVDPAILSLFLYKYYEKQGTASADNIFADYYIDATKNIASKSIAFFENHLLTLGGYRNQIPLDDALSSGITPNEVNSLLDSVILRTEKRKGIDYIEFSHDRLCVEAKKNREERIIREQARKVRRRMFLSFFVFTVSAAMLSIVILLTIKLNKETAGRRFAEEAADSITRLNIANEQHLHLNELQRDSLIDLNKKNLVQKLEIERQRDEINLKLQNEQTAKGLLAKQLTEINKLQNDIHELSSFSIIDAEAGKLAEMLPYNKLVNVINLTISGNLNDDDIKYLKRSKIKHLNIVNANIVEGGMSYNSVTNDNVISAEMFSDFNSLETIVLPQNTKSIKYGAFKNCCNLTSVVIPNNVTQIGPRAFASCESLTFVTIPGAVTRISEGLFDKCLNLIGVRLPNSLIAIDEMAFNGCKMLKNISIPENTSYIGEYAFSGCAGIKTLTIPWNIKKIGANAFKGCNFSHLINQSSCVSEDSWGATLGK